MHWPGTEDKPGRPFNASALVGGIGFIVLNGVWFGLNALHETTAGFAASAVLAILVGAIAAARTPGRVGWFGLLIGGVAGAIGVSAVTLVFIGDMGWGFLAVFGLFEWNAILVGIFGTLGFGYWIFSGSILRPRLRAAALVQGAVLALIGVGCFAAVGVTMAIPQQPEWINVRNATSVTLRFYTLDGGTLRPVWGKLDVPYPPGDASQLLDPTNPAMTGPGGILDAAGCTARELVARDPNGQEVARHGPGLCEGETWVISAPTPSG
jgi:hypothetical protein